MESMNKKYILFISYEDYMTNLGGVNKVILSQIKVAKDNGISSIFLCPLRVAKGVIGNNLWLLRIDNNICFIGDNRAVLGYLKKLSNKGHSLQYIIIHHIKNIDVHNLNYILSNIISKIYFYIHDFYTICPNKFGNLLNEDNKLCNVQVNGISKCTSCSIYNKAVKEYEFFFNAIKDRVMFVTPSDSCKDIWTSVYKDYKNQTIVIYHQTFPMLKIDGMEEYDSNKPLRVAFVGKQIVEKGWEDYKFLLDNINDDTEYEFFSCGDNKEKIKNVHNIKVSFHEGLNSMVNTLKEYKIDIVLLLSIWPETYSYTYYESYNANTFIIAFSCSGNIAYQISKNKNGRIVNSTQELVEYFNNPATVRKDVEDYYLANNEVPGDLTENEEFISFSCSDRVEISETKPRISSILYSIAYRILYHTESYIKKICKHLKK